MSIVRAILFLWWIFSHYLPDSGRLFKSPYTGFSLVIVPPMVLKILMWSKRDYGRSWHLYRGYIPHSSFLLTRVYRWETLDNPVFLTWFYPWEFPVFLTPLYHMRNRKSNLVYNFSFVWQFSGSKTCWYGIVRTFFCFFVCNRFWRK